MEKKMDLKFSGIFFQQTHDRNVIREHFALFLLLLGIEQFFTPEFIPLDQTFH
jgi:hypothetical protein